MSWREKANIVMQEIATLHTKMQKPDWQLFRWSMLDWTLWIFPVCFYSICLTNMIRHENVPALGVIGIIFLIFLIFAYCRLKIEIKKDILSTAAWIKVVEKCTLEELHSIETFRRTISSLSSDINQRNLLMQRLDEKELLLQQRLTANALSYSKLDGEIDG